MNQHTLVRIASIIIGSVIGIFVLVMGFKLLQGTLTKASDIAPRDVIVSDLSQNSVKVSWSTGEETQGVIEYGTSPTALNFFAPEPQKTKSHIVDLTLLSPATTYYFQIRIADQKYDNGGVPWTFTTKGTEKTQAPVAKPTTITRPSPMSTLVLPQNDASTVQTCDETDCNKIKTKIGKGCTARDWLICKQKSASTSAVPTATVSATPAL
ncbi:MAG: fibronectin type III domain-containing protein [Candidatus Roizmanbacteria bacterium]|nr:MAG: fibronectin type III domain-containing protein [Candidatus Roizmanbacteria bacterium]